VAALRQSNQVGGGQIPAPLSGTNAADTIIAGMEQRRLDGIMHRKSPGSIPGPAIFSSPSSEARVTALVLPLLDNVTTYRGPLIVLACQDTRGYLRVVAFLWAAASTAARLLFFFISAWRSVVRLPPGGDGGGPAQTWTGCVPRRVFRQAGPSPSIFQKGAKIWQSQ